MHYIEYQYLLGKVSTLEQVAELIGHELVSISIR